MRERIEKSRAGRRVRKSDLRINVYNISGANFLTVMFYGDSHEKITDGKYIALEPEEPEKRKEGKKKGTRHLDGGCAILPVRNVIFQFFSN